MILLGLDYGIDWYLFRAVSDYVQGIVIAGNRDECGGELVVCFGGQRFAMLELLKEVDLGCHVWERKRCVEDAGSPKCKVYSCFFQSSQPDSVSDTEWDRRFQPDISRCIQLFPYVPLHFKIKIILRPCVTAICFW